MSFIILIITSIFIIQLYKFAFLPKSRSNFTINFKSAYENCTLEKLLLSIVKNTKEYSKKIYQTKTYIDKNGYRRFKNSNILVHRWVIEKKVRRKLHKGEVVHHIDGNKLNNSKENLRLFANQAEHDKHHRKIFNKNGYWHETILTYTVHKDFGQCVQCES